MGRENPNSQGRVIEQRGPWPFVTWKRIRSNDGRELIWSSRHHRKGLFRTRRRRRLPWLPVLVRSLWIPRKLNWWIGIIFAVGALLFIIASLLCLAPSAATSLGMTSASINAVFFAGSIPFTTAAYLQLFQAANPSDAKASATACSLIGWHPSDVGWLSSLLQFAGTILFNINTFDAMLSSRNWLQEDLLVWVPNLIGSILFLISGYLAFIEICHTHWAWKPHSLSWWIVFINLLGCFGFMASALTAIVLPNPLSDAWVAVSLGCTLLGAIGFFVGALLMLPECAVSQWRKRGCAKQNG